MVCTEGQLSAAHSAKLDLLWSFFVPCCNVFCSFSFNFNKVITHVNDKWALCLLSNRSHFSFETSICVQLEYHLFWHHFNSSSSKQTRPSILDPSSYRHIERVKVNAGEAFNHFSGKFAFAEVIVCALSFQQLKQLFWLIVWLVVFQDLISSAENY